MVMLYGLLHGFEDGGVESVGIVEKELMAGIWDEDNLRALRQFLVIHQRLWNLWRHPIILAI